MEKFTREQLNSMDKDALVTLLLTYMEASQKTIDAQTGQIRELNLKIDNLIEQIALLTQRNFGRKSEANLFTGDQITIYDMGINEAEATLAGIIPREPEMEEVVIKEHKRKRQRQSSKPTRDASSATANIFCTPN